MQPPSFPRRMPGICYLPFGDILYGHRKLLVGFFGIELRNVDIQDKLVGDLFGCGRDARRVAQNEEHQQD
jgi:hypothetical protein